MRCDWCTTPQDLIYTVLWKNRRLQSDITIFLVLRYCQIKGVGAVGNMQTHRQRSKRSRLPQRPDRVTECWWYLGTQSSCTSTSVHQRELYALIKLILLVFRSLFLSCLTVASMLSNSFLILHKFYILYIPTNYRSTLHLTSAKMLSYLHWNILAISLIPLILRRFSHSS